MLKFVYEKKKLNECNPELIKRLKNPSPEDDFWTLADEFDYEEVLDAMYAVLSEKQNFNLEEAVLKYLADEYLELFTEEYSDFMGNNQFFAKFA